VAPAGPGGSLALALRNHRAGPPVPGQSRGIAVADVDRDGIPEIVLLTEDSIIAFRDRSGELERAWDNPAPQGMEPKALSVGDVDGNGVPELFVAGAIGSRPVSQALEWFGSALAPKGDRVLAFLRAIPRPGQRVVLLGRVPGPRKDLFSPGAREFRWNGSGYEEGDTFPLPASSGPLNLDWIPAPQGGLYAAVTNQDELLEIYDPDGARLFQGADPVKGAVAFLQGEERMAGYQDEDFYRVEGKTQWCPDADGSPVLLLQKNQASLGRAFNRLASFSHGQLLAMRWDGLTLTDVAEGPKIPGYIVDLDVNRAPSAQGTTLYAALVQTEGTLFRKVRSRVIAYDLPQPASTAKR